MVETLEQRLRAVLKERDHYKRQVEEFSGESFAQSTPSLRRAKSAGSPSRPSPSPFPTKRNMEVEDFSDDNVHADTLPVECAVDNGRQDELLLKLASLEAEKARLDAELASTIASTAELKEDKNSLLYRCEESSSYAEQLKEEMEELRLENQQLRKDGKEVQQRNESILESQHANQHDLQQAQLELENSQTALEQLQSQLLSVTEENEDHAVSLKQKQQECKALEQRLNASEIEANTYVAKIQALTDELKERTNEALRQQKKLEDSLEEAQQKLQTVSFEKKSLSSEKDTQLEKLSAEKEEIKKSLNESKKQVENLSTRVASLSTEKQKFEDSLEEAQQKLQTVSSEKESLNSEKDTQLEMLSAEKEEIKKSLKESKKQVENLSTQVESLLAEKQKLEDFLGEAQQKLQTISSEKESLNSEKDSQLEKLSAEKEEIRKSLNESKKQVENLSTRMESLLAEKQKFEDSFKETQQKFETVSSEKESLSSEKEEIIKSLKESEKQTENLSTQVELLLTEKQSLQVSLEEAKTDQVKRFQEIPSEQLALEKSLHESKQQINSLTSEVRYLSNRIVKYDLELQKMKECKEKESKDDHHYVHGMEVFNERAFKGLLAKYESEVQQKSDNLELIQAQLGEKESQLKIISEENYVLRKACTHVKQGLNEMQQGNNVPLHRVSALAQELSKTGIDNLSDERPTSKKLSRFLPLQISVAPHCVDEITDAQNVDGGGNKQQLIDSSASNAQLIMKLNDSESENIKLNAELASRSESETHSEVVIQSLRRQVSELEQRVATLRAILFEGEDLEETTHDLDGFERKGNTQNQLLLEECCALRVALKREREAVNALIKDSNGPIDGRNPVSSKLKYKCEIYKLKKKIKALEDCMRHRNSDSMKARETEELLESQLKMYKGCAERWQQQLLETQRKHEALHSDLHAEISRLHGQRNAYSRDCAHIMQVVREKFLHQQNDPSSSDKNTFENADSSATQSAEGNVSQNELAGSGFSPFTVHLRKHSASVPNTPKGRKNPKRTLALNKAAVLSPLANNAKRYPRDESTTFSTDQGINSLKL